MDELDRVCLLLVVSGNFMNGLVWICSIVLSFLLQVPYGSDQRQFLNILVPSGIRPAPWDNLVSTCFDFNWFWYTIVCLFWFYLLSSYFVSLIMTLFDWSIIIRLVRLLLFWWLPFHVDFISLLLRSHYYLIILTCIIAYSDYLIIKFDLCDIRIRWIISGCTIVLIIRISFLFQCILGLLLLYFVHLLSTSYCYSLFSDR